MQNYGIRIIKRNHRILPDYTGNNRIINAETGSKPVSHKTG